MKSISVILFITIFGGTWRLGRPTCVLESDFGFIINCAFKKSGLFRVRNLGGVKAHIGLGFSVGDELGFKESLSNTEVNRRRSAQASTLQAQLIQQQQLQEAQKKLGKSVIRSSPTVDGAPVPPMVAGTVRRKTDSSLSSTVPPFRPIPPAVERVASTKKSSSNSPARPSITGSSAHIDPSVAKVMAVVAVPKRQIIDKASSGFSDRILPTANNEVADPVPQHSSNSIQSLLSSNNITEEALEAALLQRQYMMMMKKKRTTTTTTTTTTTQRPITSRYSNSVGKVMNAPKEYYPVGYDKNFDDNFASRVELPETSFYCGDQKHFPGLYADEDLGCMVFHVCALTDDGLIMKSFLCPESTLFDQTILKCNWWFYVDCKNSKKLYDSNIPISKSYQLMKALTFFSTYKKDATTTTTTTTKPAEKD